MQCRHTHDSPSACIIGGLVNGTFFIPLAISSAWSSLSYSFSSLQLILSSYFLCPIEPPLDIVSNDIEAPKNMGRAIF